MGQSALNDSQGHKPSYQTSYMSIPNDGDDPPHQPEYKGKVSGLLSRSKQYGVILSTEVCFLVQIRIEPLTV